jgi:RNA polymerase sigma-70 factor (ECF subfamily)
MMSSTAWASVIGGLVGRTLTPTEWIAWILARDDGGIREVDAGTDRASLVRRASSGDQSAFETLIRGTGDRLLATARKILRDPDAAEDAVQQTVILAWRWLPRLRDPDRFDGWLYKILVSACYEEAKRVRRMAARVQPLTEEAGDDDTERWAERELIEEAFRSLTPAHRAVVVLHFYAGLPLTEVASIVGVSPGTTRSRLHYGLRALRAAIEAADRPVVVDLDR